MKVLSITTAFLAAIFFAGIAVNSVMAAPAGGPVNPDCINFVDLDLDGINDDCTGDQARLQDGEGEQKGGRKGSGPGDGIGNCDPVCEDFIDADGDGINDNCPDTGDRPQDGTGEQKGVRKGGGDGTCPNFVDEDGDGINDNCTGDGTRSQDGAGARKRINKGSPRSCDVSGSAMAPGIQDKNQVHDGSCDGTGLKTRRGVRR